MRFTVYGMRNKVRTLRLWSDSGAGASTVYGIRYAIYGIRYTVYGMRYTVYGIRYAVYGIRYVVYGIQYTVYGVILISPLSLYFIQLKVPYHCKDGPRKGGEHEKGFLSKIN